MVGSNDVTAPVIEASYERILTILDSLIEKQKFVFGGAPPLRTLPSMHS